MDWESATVLKITIRAATAFNLDRHHLTERAPTETAVKVVGDIMGLNAQGILNFQVSLWNRVKDLDKGLLPQALYHERTLVRTWLMRNTVHIVPSEQLPLFRGALLGSLMREWDRWNVKTGSKESPQSWMPHYKEILDLLKEGPLTINQMLEALGWKGREGKRRLRRVIREMSLRGILCHAKPSGYWHYETEHTYAHLDRWLPDQKPVNPEEARRELLRGYLRAYGPASPQDFAYWTGKRVSDSKPIFKSLASSLEKVKLEGQKRALYALKEDLPLVEEAEGAAAPTRLLPPFDALIMGHKDKGRLIDPRDRENIFLKYGNISASILLDGKVQGAWSIKKAGEGRRLDITPFRRFTEHERDDIEKEVDRLRRFTGFEIRVVWY
ncbi:MAG: winged helix DNA-binding domain-containing protein [Candidatus Bathyarchaeota archaeon]|jgi:uncharacterized protein YcaQ